MKPALVILFLISGIALNAQTRRIAHRFHSGADCERYDNRDGNYGEPYMPIMVKVHLESGRDTIVEFWDTLANPKYLRFIDSAPRAMVYPKMGRQEDIRNMGGVTHKLITKS